MSSTLTHSTTAPVLGDGTQNEDTCGVQSILEEAEKGITGATKNNKAKKATVTDIKSENASVKQAYRFLNELIPLMVKEALQEGTSAHNKVVDFKHPEELMKIMDLQLSDQPTDNEQLLQDCRQIIKYSVKTGHPHFFNQLFGGMDIYGIAGSWLTESLNTSSYTFEVAPVFTLMENIVLGEMLKLIGFPDGDAIFCPGGSISNIYALNLARFQCFPDIKRTGTAGLPVMCVLASEKGHYSVSKGAALLGLGMDNVVQVKTDDKGRMIPAALDEALTKVKAEGRVPIMVSATAGSTVLGSYDPLDAIADVCSKHKIWLHADGAWGGAVLLSEKLRVKMKGIERCDSLAWNPHKMMGAPLQAAAFFTKHKTLLSECHSAKAKYLFQQDKFYDVSYDTGDKSVQCGRKVDVLKLWMMWKAKGTQQFAAEIENIFNCAQYLARKLKATEGFRLVIEEPECTNVCFWYIPPSLRGKAETEEWWTALSKVAPKIKQRMVEQGTMLVGYQPDGNRVNFFRMVVANTFATFDDMDFVVSELQRLGEDL